MSSNKIWLTSEGGCGINCATSVERMEDGVRIIDKWAFSLVVPNDKWEHFEKKIIEDEEIHLSFLEGLTLSDYELQELAQCVEERIV